MLSRIICLSNVFWTSFTMCHFKEKQPFHLSCCQYSKLLSKLIKLTISERPTNYPLALTWTNYQQQVYCLFRNNGKYSMKFYSTYREEKKHRTISRFILSLLVCCIELFVTIWCTCRNLIYLSLLDDKKLVPREENQLICCSFRLSPS